jgi:hypothetical protein
VQLLILPPLSLTEIFTEQKVFIVLWLKKSRHILIWWVLFSKRYEIHSGLHIKLAVPKFNFVCTFSKNHGPFRLNQNDLFCPFTQLHVDVSQRLSCSQFSSPEIFKFSLSSRTEQTSLTHSTDLSVHSVWIRQLF